MAPLAEMMEEFREEYISKIRSNGSPEHIQRLEHLLSIEQKVGVPVPIFHLFRLQNLWAREHTKAYQTPTILKRWKDALPNPVASWFFHECDILGIEDAYFMDFDKSYGEKFFKDGIVVTTCFEYLTLTGESERHGTWFQGERVTKNIGPIIRNRCKIAAKVMRKVVDTESIDDFGPLASNWDKNFLKELAQKPQASNLPPISCIGIGHIYCLKGTIEHDPSSEDDPSNGSNDIIPKENSKHKSDK